MKVDSLDELKSAFAEWRRSKKHARERTPDELVGRARRAAEKHGVKAVVAATRVERSRLVRRTPARAKGQGATSTKAKEVVPMYSRLELSAPPGPRSRPVAEVETGTGVTVRMFEQTPEMMGLLSALCGLGGVR